jgi:O-antigen/teichoic acid export membrane protein
MSHVLRAGNDPVPILERTTRVATVVSILIIAPFAAAAPGIVPALFGEQWHATAMVLPLSCLGLLIIGPVNAASTGYLYAADRPQDVLNAILVGGIALIGVSFGFMPFAGVQALGIGVVVNAIVEVVILAVAVRRMCGAQLLKQAAVPTTVGVLAGSVGIAIDVGLGSSFESAVLGSAVAIGCALLGLVMTNRHDLIVSLRFANEALGNVVSRSHGQLAEAPPANATRVPSSATVD